MAGNSFIPLPLHLHKQPQTHPHQFTPQTFHLFRLPGDFGFDPLGLSDPEGTSGFIEPRWLAYGEVINGRFAMLGAAGAIAPEIFGKLSLIPPETALPWFQTGVIPPAGTYKLGEGSVLGI